MADYEEYQLRQHALKTNIYLQNFQEGYWQSPCKTKIIRCILSYEGSTVNISWNKKFHTSIYPIAWDFLFDNWTYLGRELDGDLREENPQLFETGQGSFRRFTR